MFLKELLVFSFLLILGVSNPGRLRYESMIRSFFHQKRFPYSQNAEIILDKKERLKIQDLDLLFRKYNFEILKIEDRSNMNSISFFVNTVIRGSEFEDRNDILVYHSLHFQKHQIIKHFIYLFSTVTTNPIKLALQEGRSVYGGFLSIPHPKVVENLAMSHKLDFIWIEAEHSEFGPKDSQNLVRTCQSVQTTPIVRVPINGLENIKKYVGSGTAGIIIPNIASVEDATLAYQSCKYPPVGHRHAGVERANGYLENFQEYFKTANENMLVGIMIETAEAVESIDILANMTEIDLLHLGPFDLSLSLGVSMQSEVFKQAVAKVEATARLHNKPLGGAANTYNDSIAMIEKGYRFFTIPGDMTFLQTGVSNWFAEKRN